MLGFAVLEAGEDDLVGAVDILAQGCDGRSTVAVPDRFEQPAVLLVGDTVVAMALQQVELRIYPQPDIADDL